MGNNSQRAGAVAEFLRITLAQAPVGVSELEVMARASGLLGEHQGISDAKRFKLAKKFLGIRSVREGFGSGGSWVWVLPVFGCHHQHPLLYLGSAGLMWDISGGELVHLYRDGAVVKRTADKREHFHRRRPADADVTLPWIGLTLKSRG
jgi:hypothetical protein